ncbi:hypothetical protein HZH66_010024 [Vespula vulgaris]|uniref:Uncharacterized protein n=1 Tax=Vespula vulgaris TaxID=7454 RepID=A0A834JKP7_VESVU|nr:hypothetical protein HZH66_010024 [Vespula vulgaris]
MEYRSDVSGIIIEEKLEDFLAPVKGWDGEEGGNGKLWTLNCQLCSNNVRYFNKRELKGERVEGWKRRDWNSSLKCEKANSRNRVSYGNLIFDYNALDRSILYESMIFKILFPYITKDEYVHIAITIFIIGLNLLALLRRKTANEDVTARRMKEWMDGWMDERMDGWMDGWNGGWSVE